MAGMTELFDKGLDKAMPDAEQPERGSLTVDDLRAVASPEEAELLDALVAKAEGGPTEEPVDVGSAPVEVAGA